MQWKNEHFIINSMLKSLSFIVLWDETLIDCNHGDKKRLWLDYVSIFTFKKNNNSKKSINNQWILTNTSRLTGSIFHFYIIYSGWDIMMQKNYHIIWSRTDFTKILKIEPVNKLVFAMVIQEEVRNFTSVHDRTLNAV